MDHGGAYDKIALQYEERKRQGASAVWTEQLLRRWVEALPASAAVLDLGCGHGIEVARMHDLGLNALGVDLSLGMLRRARRRARGRVAQADAIHLPLRDASVDGVWSLHALLHVPDLNTALGEVARVLKSGGMSALTVALGEGLSVEPVPYQPAVSRQFVHWSGDAVLDAMTAARLRVLDQGVDTDGRATMWMLAERR